MTIIKSAFTLALNQVATEKGISPDEVVSSIEAAILAAYKKEYPDDFDDAIIVRINRTTGESHILLNEKDITPPGFGRIAAQTARQVMLQKIRESEKKNVISYYRDHLHTIIRGRIIRYDGYNAYVDIGRSEAILPREEQIRNEKYQVNTSMLFYLKDISEDPAQRSRILVSRAAPELIKELFAREVPEIANGTVEIKVVVREPGERAKIAVDSTQHSVDPGGACIIQKNTRVETVTEELGGNEKIDIIQWSADPATFISSALSPAKIIKVDLDETEKSAKITVDESQAPLAIGVRGVNVNLASRLTEYKLDIVQLPGEKKQEEEPQAADESPDEEPETDNPSTDEAEAQA